MKVEKRKFAWDFPKISGRTLANTYSCLIGGPETRQRPFPADLSIDFSRNLSKFIICSTIIFGPTFGQYLEF